MSVMPEPEDPHAEANALLERWRSSELDDELRRIGVYVDDFTVAGTHTGPVILLECKVGKVAFSKRVQDSEQDGFDDQFRAFEVAAKRDAFLDERARIERCMEAGVDPFSPEAEGI